MATIGIYDSGIGGLTTLATLFNAIDKTDYFYLADNKNMPFGSKTAEEIDDIAADGIKTLEAHSDCSVLACNTASVITTSREVFKLLPTLDGLSPEETLIMATPLTLKYMTTADFLYKTAETPELARLTEIQASVIYKNKSQIDMSALHGYLKICLNNFDNIRNVVLGCSHYIYLKDEIKKILGDVNFFDGNDVLAQKVKKFANDKNRSGKIKFAFTGANEENKYRYIFEKLQKTIFFQG